jgi:NAD(P)-dependent dehydrogenase (short-subunit alcohol dehydrogenase family)
MSKAALERMTVDVARQLAPAGVACNCFRIDVPVASEGFVANLPDVDHSDWEPADVPAEGIVWMLRQPADYTGRVESMAGLRDREGIMASRAERPFTGFVPGR